MFVDVGVSVGVGVTVNVGVSVVVLINVTLGVEVLVAVNVIVGVTVGRSSAEASWEEKALNIIVKKTIAKIDSVFQKARACFHAHIILL